MGPTPHPNPRLPAGGAAWLRAPRRAAPRQEPLHPRRGPEPAAPAPAARGHCCMVSVGLGCRAEQQQRRVDTVWAVRRQATPTYPFCCGALSASGGAPKGRAVLLRELLGAKVYLGVSAAGARAWVETEPGRAGRGGGMEGGLGQSRGEGQPLPLAESTVVLQPHLYTSGRGFRGGGDSGFKGPIWEQ